MADNGLPKKQSSRGRGAADCLARRALGKAIAQVLTWVARFLITRAGLKERSETRRLRLQKLGLGLCTDNPPPF